MTTAVAEPAANTDLAARQTGPVNPVAADAYDFHDPAYDEAVASGEIVLDELPPEPVVEPAKPAKPAKADKAKPAKAPAKADKAAKAKGKAAKAAKPAAEPEPEVAAAAEEQDEVEGDDLDDDELDDDLQDELDADDDAPAGEEAAADEFDDAILARAAQYQFSPEEARATGSRENLAQVLRAIDARESKAIRAMLDARQPAADPNAQAAAAEPAKPAEAAAAPAPAEAAAHPAAFEKLKLDLTGFDPETVKLVDTINDHYHAQHERANGELVQLREAVKTLAGTLEGVRHEHTQITGRTKAEEQARAERDTDSFLDGLGDEFTPLYGKGRLGDIKPGSDEHKNRIEFFRETLVQRLADDAAGRHSTESELRERAVAVLHRDLVSTTARKKIAAQLEARRGQALARPTGRQAVNPTGRERAKARERSLAREHGDDADDDDFVL